MYRRRLRARSSLLVSGLGVALFLVALVHHVREAYLLGTSTVPGVALLVDGLPALALAYAAVRLQDADLLPEDRFRVAVWCCAGALLFALAMGLTLLVRVVEGRVVAEPIFPLLVAVEAGGLAGVVAGYYAARSHSDARRATAVSEALAFVNDLIRHDLKNDLTVIRGQAHLLDEVVADDAGDDAVSVIVEKTDEANARLETTGAVAETLSGDPDLEPVDLAAVVAETAARIGNTFAVSVDTDLPDQALVTANAGLRSVVDNLLENAVEHNDADDPHLWVAVDADAGESAVDDAVRLTVADDGPGIPDERKDSLFEVAADGAGRGGLVIVRTLVEGYGGAVRVEDREPRGSVFVADVPGA